MKKVPTKLLISIFLISGVLSVYFLAATRKPAPLIIHDFVDQQKLTEPLQFNWKIKNTAHVPICVLTTYLLSNSYPMIDVNSEERTIDLLLAFKRLMNGYPYNFRDIELTQVNPEAELEGQFISINNIQDILIDGKKITPGAWKVRILLAYGYGDSDSAVKEIEALKVNRPENLFNPFVRWQNLIYSVYETITVLD